jgi:hypothetical protein
MNTDHGRLVERVVSRFRAVDQLRAHYPVKRLCRVLGVSPSDPPQSIAFPRV